MFLFLGGIVYGGIAAWRTADIYRYVKTSQRGWTGDVYQADSALGYSHIPGGSGAETYPIGPDVPSRIDENGFRIPVEAPAESASTTRTKVLALGCSFTFGSTCPAEETFPYLVARGLNARCLNAGICGAGLAQMQILAERLIPEHRPDVVLVQYSPWLVDRALSPFAPTYWGTYPSPYYVKTPSGAFAIQAPVFEASTAPRAASAYRGTEKTKSEFLSFFFKVGLKHCLYEDVQLGSYKLKVAAGRIPQPTDDRAGLVKHVYSEIHRQCEKVGARMIIVGMRDNFENNSPMPRDSFPPGVAAVDTRETLVKHLNQPTGDAWKRAYFHWRGTPPSIVDGHPNSVAHRIISAAVLQQLPASTHTANRPKSAQQN